MPLVAWTHTGASFASLVLVSAGATYDGVGRERAARKPRPITSRIACAEFSAGWSRLLVHLTVRS